MLLTTIRKMVLRQVSLVIIDHCFLELSYIFYERNRSGYHNALLYVTKRNKKG